MAAYWNTYATLDSKTKHDSTNCYTLNLKNVIKGIKCHKDKIDGLSIQPCWRLERPKVVDNMVVYVPWWAWRACRRAAGVRGARGRRAAAGAPPGAGRWRCAAAPEPRGEQPLAAAVAARCSWCASGPPRSPDDTRIVVICSYSYLPEECTETIHLHLQRNERRVWVVVSKYQRPMTI